MYNDTTKYISERQKNGDVFVICPDAPLEISRIEHSPEKLLAVYNMGRSVAERELEKIKEFLGK
jgi:predicted patatin/cPLA2 family phospholipase